MTELTGGWEIMKRRTTYARDVLQGIRPARSFKDTLAYLREHAGCQFDPDVVKAFLAMIGESRPGTTPEA